MPLYRVERTLFERKPMADLNLSRPGERNGKRLSAIVGRPELGVTRQTVIGSEKGYLPNPVKSIFG